jgi:alpha-glucosidase (family GH31 glycosyl hydrolase)
LPARAALIFPRTLGYHSLVSEASAMRKAMLAGLSLLWCLTLAGCGLFGGPSCSQNGSAVVCGNARFEALTPSLLRIEYEPSGHFVDARTAVVTGREWPAAKFTFKQQHGWLIASTDRLTLRYHLGSGLFNDRNLLISWRDNGSDRTWNPGQKDPLNLGGLSRSLDGAEQNHFSQPTEGLLSRSGYYLLDDSRSPVWNSKTDWIEPRPGTNDQDWYFFEYGRDYPAALKDYARLCGRVPMIPRYALGTMITDLNYEYLPTSDLVSKYHYSDKDVEKLVTRFRSSGIPLDVLVLDFAWHNYGWQGGYDWSPIFPHPKEFLDWAHHDGLKISLNDHPGYADWLNDKTALSDKDSHAAEVHRQLGIPSGQIIRWNLAEKRQAEVFMRDLHFPLMDEGVDFWWVDGGSGAVSMPGLDPQLWTNRVFYDFSQQHTGKRAFIMSRNGGWGNNRYPGFFTGDTHSTWDVLSYEIDYTARGGNVLEPYITHDIGGFLGQNVPFDLYARWVQFGVFSPLVRLHSQYENPKDGNVRMPWTYGQQGINLVRRYFRLRYQLLPYIYTYSRIAYDNALPLLRPLYLEYPSLPKAYVYPKEYFFGKEILVAPISDPSGDEEVYLPPGTWTDYLSGKSYDGDQLLGVQAPIDFMPIFIKNGSIIPLAPDNLEYSNQKPLDHLTLAVYGPDAASFRLYEDDGTSLAYKNGQFAWTPISFKSSGTAQWQMVIGPTDGQFQGQVDRRAYEIQLHNLPEPTSVNVDGQSIPQRAGGAPGWSWNRAKSVATIRLNMHSIRAPIHVAIASQR